MYEILTNDIIKDIKFDFIKELLVLDKVDSTNTFVLNKARTGSPEGFVVLAEEQFKGRGRNQKIWHSQKGMGLWFSISKNRSR